jgi:hypothetical protein
MGIRRSSARIAFSSEIDLLMYSTFAVQSGEGARQQRLALVLPYVLLWSNRAVIHLDRDDSWTNPPPSGWKGPRSPNAPGTIASSLSLRRCEDSGLLFLAEFLESGIGPQRVPEWIEPKKGRRNRCLDVKPTIVWRL